VSDTIRNGIDKTALSYWFPKLVDKKLLETILE
jgi:hypothetical protein